MILNYLRIYCFHGLCEFFYLTNINLLILLEISIKGFKPSNSNISPFLLPSLFSTTGPSCFMRIIWCTCVKLTYWLSIFWACILNVSLCLFKRDTICDFRFGYLWWVMSILDCWLILTGCCLDRSDCWFVRALQFILCGWKT